MRKEMEFARRQVRGAAERTPQRFPLHGSWRPRGEDKTGIRKPSTQHHGSSLVPDRAPGRALRAGLSHPDVLQQLACLSREGSKLEPLCPAPFPPAPTTAGPEGGLPDGVRPQSASALPLPQAVMTCRKMPPRGVRTISIKHNFLIKRLQENPVELIRIECSLQPALRGLRRPEPGPQQLQAGGKGLGLGKKAEERDGVTLSRF